MMIHTFFCSCTLDPPLIRNRLLHPVCLALLGFIENKDLQFSIYQHSILHKSGIHFPGAYLCPQERSDILFGPRYLNLLFDPVNVSLRGKQLQQLHRTFFQIDSLFPIHIKCHLFFCDLLCMYRHFRKRFYRKLSRMDQ